MSADLSTPTATRAIRAAGARADAESLRAAYLDLLKLCLCDLTGVRTRTLTLTGDRRLFSRELTGDQVMWRAEGKDWPLDALTMVGLVRLDDLQACVETLVADGIEGDLIEAGTWRGGASILMRATLDSLGADDRTVWLADSFQGFPLPELAGAGDDRELEDDLTQFDFLAVALEDVKGYLARFGCERGVKFLPGFFEETLSEVRDERWSLLRLDGDTYKATWTTLEELYPRLSVGGYVVIDEYHHSYLPMCRRAVDDFRREYGIKEPIERIDFSAARWRREDETPISIPRTPAAVPASEEVDRARTAPVRAPAHIPTDRELQLSDQVAELSARVGELEAEVERLAGSRRGRLGRG